MKTVVRSMSESVLPIFSSSFMVSCLKFVFIGLDTFNIYTEMIFFCIYSKMMTTIRLGNFHIHHLT